MKENCGEDRNRKTTLLFSAFTSFQLVTSIYYSTKLKNENCTRVLIWNDALSGQADAFLGLYFDEVFIIRNQNQGRFLIAVHSILQSGRLFQFSKVGKRIRNSNRIILFAFSDQASLTYHIMDLVKKKENYVFLVEEGLGTYGAKDNRNFSLGLIAKLIGIKSVAYIGASGLFDAYIVKDPERLPTNKTMGKKLIKQNVFYADSVWMNSILFFDESVFNELKLGKKMVLWLGSPIETCYPIPKDNNDVVLLHNIAKAFPEIEFIIKTHPSENDEKYKGSLTPNVNTSCLKKLSWIPIEIIAGKLKPDILMTVVSTSAENLYEIGTGGSVIYCVDMFPSLKVDKNVFSYMRNKSNHYFPKDIGELQQVMQECRESNQQGRNRIINKNYDIEFITKMIREYD